MSYLNENNKGLKNFFTFVTMESFLYFGCFNTKFLTQAATVGISPKICKLQKTIIIYLLLFCLIFRSISYFQQFYNPMSFLGFLFSLSSILHEYPHHILLCKIHILNSSIPQTYQPYFYIKGLFKIIYFSMQNFIYSQLYPFIFTIFLDILPEPEFFL